MLFPPEYVNVNLLNVLFMVCVFCSNSKICILARNQWSNYCSGHPAPVILKATAGETASAKPANGRAAVKFNASMTVTAAAASNGKPLEKVDEKDEESSEDDESDSGDSRDEDNRSNSKPKGFKNETSEEKRIRKSKVKEEKRLRRLQKKANKQSFRLEECRSSSLMQKSSSGSIYKY